MKPGFLLSLSLLLTLPGFAQTPTTQVAELKPTDQECLVKFTILDPKGLPEEGAVVKVDAVDKKFSKKGVTDIDGKCAILVPEGAPFNLVVHKFSVDFDFGVQNMAIKPGAYTTNMKLTIELVTTYRRVYTMKRLYFEPSQFEIKGLKAESMDELNHLLDTLKNNAKMKVEIAGHTDNVGDDLANLHLSQKRADAIREYLISKGIHEDRVLAKGYGETQPIASNDTPEGKSFNRRIEVKVIEE